MTAVSLVALPLAVVLPKGIADGADNRCNRAMPEDAWGYTINWAWSEFGWVCRYEGGDYRPTGEERRIGLTDLI
jgi:hypothetical protein